MAAAQKVDLDKLTAEEKLIYQKYGKLPNKKDLIGHKLKERKYFDSGDYAMYKAGKPSGPVGSAHPSPDSIPHSNPTSNHQPAQPHHSHMAPINAGEQTDSGAQTPVERVVDEAKKS